VQTFHSCDRVNESSAYRRELALADGSHARREVGIAEGFSAVSSFHLRDRISSPLEMGTLVVYPTNCERCEASATRVYFSLKRS